MAFTESREEPHEEESSAGTGVPGTETLPRLPRTNQGCFMMATGRSPGAWSQPPAGPHHLQLLDTRVLRKGMVTCTGKQPLPTTSAFINELSALSALSQYGLLILLKAQKIFSNRKRKTRTPLLVQCEKHPEPYKLPLNNLFSIQYHEHESRQTKLSDASPSPQDMAFCLSRSFSLPLLRQWKWSCFHL